MALEASDNLRNRREQPNKSFSPTAVWQGALDSLRRSIAGPSFDTWLADTYAIGMNGGILQIGVATDFAREALTTQYYPTISEALTTAAGRRIQFEFVVASKPPSDVSPAEVT